MTITRSTTTRLPLAEALIQDSLVTILEPGRGHTCLTCLPGRSARLPGTIGSGPEITYATALVNAGVSLQSLMVLLGHQTAAMSLRYGRLFNATVRDEYERALTMAKDRMGAVLPDATPVTLNTNWRDAPMIKSRLAGGYCVRAEAQGACAYANICEHCPNFRTDASHLAVLAAQRVDAEALAADAEHRGWVAEADRHRRLIERLDLHITRAQAG